MAMLRRVLEKLRAGLSKTRQKFANSFRALLTVGRRIDDDLLDELESTLIGSSCRF